MGQRLSSALQVHRLASDLGLGRQADPVAAIRLHCRKRLLGFLGEIPCTTLSELLALSQDRLGTRFIEAHSDEDVARIQAEYVARREFGFSQLAEELSSAEVFAITFRLQSPEPWERQFVSVIDCRGPKKYRAYFSKWHELAHLLTLTNQMRLTFRRTHLTEEVNDPEERLMEVLAGDGAFLPELIVQHAVGPISFEAIRRIRDRLCPDASDQASRIGIVQAWPIPCLMVRAKLALKKEHQRQLAQMRFGFSKSPLPALRAVEVDSNSAARSGGFSIPRNMRIPEESVIFRAYPNSDGDLEAEEDLAWWSSQGRHLETKAVQVVARGLGDEVLALISPAK